MSSRSPERQILAPATRRRHPAAPRLVADYSFVVHVPTATEIEHSKRVFRRSAPEIEHSKRVFRRSARST